MDNESLQELLAVESPSELEELLLKLERVLATHEVLEECCVGWHLFV